jgi:hypothetical protein
MFSQFKDSAPLCRICIDDANCPLRKDDYSSAILSAARVIPPHAKKPLSTVEESYIWYPKTPETNRLTEAALEAFNKAYRLADAALAKIAELERYLSYISDEVMINFNRLPESALALERNDIYRLWPFFVRAWSGEGASRATVYLDRAVTAKQHPSETHLRYADRLAEIFRVSLQH